MSFGNFGGLGVHPRSQDPSGSIILITGGIKGITHIRAEIGVNGVHKRVGAINR